MRFHALLAFAGALSLSSLASCVMPRIDATPRYGTFDVDGEVGVSSSNITAKNSLDQAGLVKDDSVPGARVDFDWIAFHLSVNLQSSNHDGDGTLEADVSQGGVTIPAGTQVDSKLDLGLHNAILTFDLLPTDMFELGIGLGVAVADVESSFTEQGNPANRVETDEAIPIPMVALRGGLDFGRLEFSALVGGIAGTLDGDQIQYLDLDVYALVRLFGGDDHFSGALGAGYRHVDLDLEYDDGGDSVDAELAFDGPYVGFTLGF